MEVMLRLRGRRKNRDGREGLGDPERNSRLISGSYRVLAKMERNVGALASEVVNSVIQTVSRGEFATIDMKCRTVDRVEAIVI